jgi:hypothetical protein
LLTPLSLPAFGTVEDFTTNKSLYHDGDQIIISGNVSYDPSNPFVIIQVITPNHSDIAGIAQIQVSSNGSFSSDTIHTGGSKWNVEGYYTVKVIYNGFLEKSIEYKESSTPSPSTPEPESTIEPESTPKPESTPEPVSSFTTLKLQIPNFPSLDKSPQFYIDRYNHEPSYKSWFDSQFPFNSITDVVGYKLTSLDSFPSLDKSPQFYLDRYNHEPSYKSWFDSQFSYISIYNILGYEDPTPLPPEMKSDAGKWATGAISDSTFVAEIEFMLENNIIMISNIPSGDASGDEIPAWVRNNALWWSQDLISEYEFVNSLKFLIQEGIIMIN